MAIKADIDSKTPRGLSAGQANVRRTHKDMRHPRIQDAETMSEDLTTMQRRIRNSLLRNPDSTPQALAVLRDLDGVTAATADDKGIRVRYDAARLQYPLLLQALDDQGLLGELDWWERVKRSWYSDQDCIARDNARAKPSPCCSNPSGIMAQSTKKKHH